MDGMPEFLDRKQTPLEPATVEDRREYAARCPVPVDPPKLGLDDEVLKEEKLQKARARIAKMKAGFKSKADAKALASIPQKFLCWDTKRLRFYDVRARGARKLIAVRLEMGLPPMTLEAAMARSTEIMEVV